MDDELYRAGVYADEHGPPPDDGVLGAVQAKAGAILQEVDDLACILGAEPEMPATTSDPMGSPPKGPAPAHRMERALGVLDRAGARLAACKTVCEAMFGANEPGDR